MTFPFRLTFPSTCKAINNKDFFKRRKAPKDIKKTQNVIGGRKPIRKLLGSKHEKKILSINIEASLQVSRDSKTSSKYEKGGKKNPRLHFKH